MKLTVKLWLGKSIVILLFIIILFDSFSLEMSNRDEFESVHQHFMKEAFEQALKAVEMGEVPVGCVFVRDGEVIARGHNLTNITGNATKHAEFNAIRELSIEIENIVSTQLEPCKLLKGVTLYVTVEPCIMCAWALRLLSVEKVYYGASNPRFGGNGSVLSLQTSLEPIGENKHVLDSLILTQVYSCFPGLLGDEAVLILKDFYGQENVNAPPEKRKKGKFVTEIN